MYFYFAYPWFLLLLPLVPLVMWRWRRRPRPALRYSDLSLLAGLPAGRSRWVDRLGMGMRGLALLLLVLALAGPRWADRIRIRTEGIAIGMIVDTSGSMAERDFIWDGDKITRLQAAQKAFELFVTGAKDQADAPLAGRPNDLISLVAFAARPEVVCPLTLSHSALISMLKRLKAGELKNPGDTGTNLSDALALSLYRLQSAGQRRKVLILLTDGEHNLPNPRSEWKPRQAAQIAANLHIPIYTIDAGKPTEVDKEVRAAGIHTLDELSRITKGQYFQAHDTKTLLQVCNRIDRLERREVESFQYQTFAEGFPWLGLAAFLLILGVYALEMTIWQRIP